MGRAQVEIPTWARPARNEEPLPAGSAAGTRGSGALHPLARIDSDAVRRALAAHRGSAGWRSCDEAVSPVENAGFVNATLTGAP